MEQQSNHKQVREVNNTQELSLELAAQVSGGSGCVWCQGGGGAPESNTDPENPSQP